MSDNSNPLSDTWAAVKTRLAGPFGTFAFVWLVEHPKVLAFVLFDATGDSKLPQADAKIQKIAALLESEGSWTIFWRPLAWTILIMLLLQAITLAWHYVCEWFRYYEERVTSQKDFRIYIYRRFGKNPDDVIITAKNEIQNALGKIKGFSSIGQGISAIDKATRNEAIITAMNKTAEECAKRLEVAAGLLSAAGEDPLAVSYRKWQEDKTP